MLRTGQLHAPASLLKILPLQRPWHKAPRTTWLLVKLKAIVAEAVEEMAYVLELLRLLDPVGQCQLHSNYFNSRIFSIFSWLRLWVHAKAHLFWTMRRLHVPTFTNSLIKNSQLKGTKMRRTNTERTDLSTWSYK